MTPSITQAEPRVTNIRPGRPDTWTGSKYGRAALHAELDRLEQTPAGHRHKRIYAAARALGELVAGGELDANTTTEHLHQMGRTIGLPEADVLRAVRRGFDHGARRPRSQSSPPIHNATDARAEILRWWGQLDQDDDLRTRAGATSRRIFAAFALCAFAAGTTNIAESYREIAECAGVSIATISRHRRHYAELWTRHVELVRAGNVWTGSRSRWRLRIRASTPEATAPFPRARAASDPSHNYWFRWATGWNVCRHLELETGKSYRELAEATGLHPGSVRRILARLRADGVAQQDADALWTATDTLPADEAGIIDIAERRRARHRVQRELWQRQRREIIEQRRQGGTCHYATARLNARGVLCAVSDETTMLVLDEPAPTPRFIQPYPVPLPALIVDAETGELAPPGVPLWPEPIGIDHLGRLFVRRSGEILLGGRDIPQLLDDIADAHPDFDPCAEPTQETA